MNHPTRPSVELLAPAGGPDALRAAVANGADAVYLGVDELNARRSAVNFTLATLPETCRFAHLRGVRVYLTVNVVVLPHELQRALSLIDEAWAAGVDAVILQDLGLLWAVRSQLPHVRVHSSTQINTHNTPTIELLGDLGVSRITLAREVSIEEIARFCEQDRVQVEAFVHGALCVCYSGQCLMSSLIGRRSANRGMCAQPCRLPYELVTTDGSVLEAPGAHLLSPKDLAGIAVLPSLVEAGIAALKIEGRMKSPEYVALVTRVYRGALDRALSTPDTYEVRDGELAVLGESFSRGFSEAYLVSERGNDMMSYKRPNNRGVPVGRVVATRTGFATVALDTALESGDTVEFWTSAGRFAQSAGSLTLDGSPLGAAAAGSRVEVAVEQSVSTGDRVFRVRNAALSSAAARTFDNDSDTATLGLTFQTCVVAGEPLSVTVTDEQGRSGSASGSVVELARTKAVTAEEVAEHVGRLGGTPYTIDRWELDLSPNVGIGFSALHRVRREALESYEAGVLAPWAGRTATAPRLPRLVGRGKRPPRSTARMKVVAIVGSEESAAACLDAGADSVRLDVAELGAAHRLPQGVVPSLPRIAHDRELDSMLEWVEAGKPVLCANLGTLSQAVRRGAHVEADWGLNVVNAATIAQLAELGARFAWLSPELSGEQIASVTADSALPVGVTVFGRQELMVTEHCVLMAQGPCNRACATCARRDKLHLLKDRKGYQFPVRTDHGGRSHVFNSVPLDLGAVVGELASAGLEAVALDLRMEEPGTITDVVRRFARLAELVAVGQPIPGRDKSPSTTSGHYFRGIV